MRAMFGGRRSSQALCGGHRAQPQVPDQAPLAQLGRRAELLGQQVHGRLEICRSAIRRLWRAASS
ncbi:hypothetical protein [Streptomyces sp. NPDC001480]|uniref:hypothetical protein n=1 Tax=Streptomyces sp. NPDC001480 TaxID=3364577 RepID=UPI00369BCD33